MNDKKKPEKVETPEKKIEDIVYQFNKEKDEVVFDGEELFIVRKNGKETGTISAPLDLIWTGLGRLEESLENLFKEPKDRNDMINAIAAELLGIKQNLAKKTRPSGLILPSDV